MLIVLRRISPTCSTAPGRTIKYGLVAYVPIAIVIGTADRHRHRTLDGVAFGLSGDDLRERLMLGDTGANDRSGAWSRRGAGHERGLALAVMPRCSP
jgi:hypothetical protein